MYAVQLMAQLKAKEVEELAREAWKLQRPAKERVFFKGWIGRKDLIDTGCKCACVC